MPPPPFIPPRSFPLYCAMIHVVHTPKMRNDKDTRGEIKAMTFVFTIMRRNEDFSLKIQAFWDADSDEAAEPR